MAQVFLASQALDGISGHETGRKLLAQLYAAHAEGELPEIAIAPGGKPYFVTSPWHFSISHTKRHAFCALADCPIGIDAEEADRAIDLKIAPKILSPGEFSQFAQADDPRDCLLRFWVLKEASAKWTGEGIRWHPNHTSFSLPDRRIQELEGCLLAVVY